MKTDKIQQIQLLESPRLSVTKKVPHHIYTTNIIIGTYKYKHYGYKHHGYMHHGYMHNGYMHHGYIHHRYMHHKRGGGKGVCGHLCMGDMA